jgi:glucose/arabinose dehydrogenase
MSHFMKNTLLLVFLFSLSSLHCQKRKTPSGTPQQPGSSVTIKDKILTQNLVYPWEVLWGPDNFIWMTQKGGTISRVNPGNGVVTSVYTIPDVQTNGEGGLLGMALHPDFSANPYVYISYNYNSTGTYKEKLVRFTYNGSTLTAPLILIDNIAASGIHNGSRLLIVNGKLFCTTGDASNQSLPQNTSSINGKVLRVNLDGSIPTDNPLPNNPVWSWGHRNPQGLVMVGNKMFSSEHGPSNDDEINIIEKGRNYGWPNIEGFCNTTSEQSFCSANNVKGPITAWTPTIAVSGMEYYNSDAIPQWKNSLLVATLKNSRLYQLKLNNDATGITDTQQFFTNTYGRLRDVCISPDGKVYICTSNGSNDKIIEVSKE